MDKLSIANEMAMFDKKNREFFNSLTPDERKKFSTFLMIRWGSGVYGSRDLQEFYLIATNERLNKHFFTLHKHPELQWLMATTVSPGMGNQRHEWIKQKKKEAGEGSVKKALADLYPNMKDSDLDVLASMTTKKDITQLNKAMGNDK